MPDASLSEAIREAYASAPSDVVIFHTLELRHPDFVDEEGAPTAIRVVRDRVDLFAHLESSAPLHPGQEVRFVAMAFDLNLPAVDSMPVPEVEITLDNVTREVMRHLDAAVQSQQMIEVTYRPYLSNDLLGPQMDPPLTLVLSFVEANPLRITARARMVGAAISGLAALPTRDALLPMLSLLARSARERCSISALVGALPERYTYSDRIKDFPAAQSRDFLKRLVRGPGLQARVARKMGTPRGVDTTDGVRLTFPDGDIVHLRASGNAPELRCYAEAASLDVAKALCMGALSRVL